MVRNSRFRFRRVGGAWQPRIDTADDLKNLLRLDEALWAMTGVSIDILRFDSRFLHFLDASGEGRIHCDEVKKALRFLLDSLRDLSGVMQGADSIRLADLKSDNPGVPEMLDAARLFLRYIGKADGESISLSDFNSPQGKEFLSRASRSGAMLPEEDFPPEFQDILRMMEESGRTTLNTEGKRTLSLEQLDDFLLCAAKRLEHQEIPFRNPALLFAGDETEKSASLYREVAAAIDQCFLNAAARKFFASDPERMEKKECKADLWEPADVLQALERSAAAETDPEGMLDFSAPLNPLFREKLRAFSSLPFVRKFLEGTRLSEERWQALKAEVSPYEAWRDRVPAGDGMDSFSPERIASLFAGGKEKKLRCFVEEYLRVDAAAVEADRLFILLLLQQNFLRFLRNFVTLEDLFDPSDASRLQAGVLVMDGRHFTLAIPVKNIEEHKKIVRKSSICVLYVEIFARQKGVDRKQSLSVGVTDGTMDTLFIGKQGVFFDADGECWGAKVVDMLPQPVSIGEALKAPFCRFGEMVVRQTEKIFNTRSEEMQKRLNSSLTSVIPPVSSAPAANSSAASSPGLPMLLMGGGIGLAAVGSSIAFIAKSLRSVSLLSILAVLAGIFLVFGAPIVLLALTKLFRRNLALFLESSGCSLNHSMRLSFRMGTIFTFSPRRPVASMLWKDPSDAFAAFRRREKKPRKWCRRFLLLLLIFGILCGVFFLGRHLFFSVKSLSPASSASLEKAKLSDKTDEIDPSRNRVSTTKTGEP